MLTIVRADVSEDLSSTTLSQLFFGETHFPCCGDNVDSSTASTEDLVRVPMSCSLRLANNTYIPVAIFWYIESDTLYFILFKLDT